MYKGEEIVVAGIKLETEVASRGKGGSEGTAARSHWHARQLLPWVAGT